ncbi:nitrite/sulfite reductase, partial [Veillonella parvula]|nr:nitrite/sulfite reductase [Veillonella parvula]
LKAGDVTVNKDNKGTYSLIACVGKGHCKNGQMETKELADYVERKHYGRKTSHKYKIGISGCGRNCPDAMVKDIAFIGTSQGFMLAVGGNTGMRPEAGKILARKLTIEQSKNAVDILIDWYAKYGDPR